MRRGTESSSSPAANPEVIVAAADQATVPWTFGDILRGVAGGFALFVLTLVPITLIMTLAVVGDGGSVPVLVLVSVSLYLCMSLALWFFTIRKRGTSLAAVGFVPARLSTFALMPFLAFGALILNGAIVMILRRVIGEIPDVRDQVLADGARTLAGSELLLLLVMGAVVAPFAEEFFFRGLLYRYLRARWSFVATATATSLVFAVVHGSPRLIPSLFVLGLILAGVVERYRSVYPAIAVHALNNAFALGALYLALA